MSNDDSKAPAPLLGPSASEEIAARLARLDTQGIAPESVNAVGEFTEKDVKEGLASAELETAPAPPSKEHVSSSHQPPSEEQGPATPQHAKPTPSLRTQEEDIHIDVDELLKQAPFIHQVDDPDVNGTCYEIKPGHVKHQIKPARFFASPRLLRLVVDELQTAGGAFNAAVEQLCNVATLPGLVGASVGMPDIHSGYGFAIGNVAAFDMDDKKAIVSPGGVGFDINCGVRVLRTNLHVNQVSGKVRQRLAEALADLIPVGVGEAGAVKMSAEELERALSLGMEWAEQRQLCWPEDRLVVEENGRFMNADPSKVSERAKKRGRPQAGSLGSGNHYVEVQAVDEIYHEEAANVMGITRKGQVCVMIHTGSRGLGHQVATDALAVCDVALSKSKIKLVDRQLACVPIHSKEGQSYLGAMAAAANFAFCNRTVVMNCVREAFERVFARTARDLDMHMVYDVSHNIAKVEEHDVETSDGQTERKKLLVHRKGATRAFPPHHPSLPEKYQSIGQPVLIGGSMGTASYILLGTEGAMKRSFGSTCHGAGRALSRSKAIKTIDSKSILAQLASKGIIVKVATRHLAAEESPAAYKDVDSVVATCELAGLSKKVARLVPLAVVKG